MQKKIILSIPEPCHQNWDQMNPTEKGRFCLSCQKEVIDFSSMTDKEVFNFFEKKKNQDVCGKTYNDQLNTPILKPIEPKKKKLWYVQYLTTLFLLINKSETKAQTKPAITASPVDRNMMVGMMIALPQNVSHTVSGKISDENGHPIAFASVNIKGLKQPIASDQNGTFFIKVNGNTTLYISALGYSSEQKTITNQTSVNIVLKKIEVIKNVAVTMGMVSRVIPIKKEEKPVSVLQEKISAQIVDEKGSPVGFASINIKGTNVGVSANENGDFSIPFSSINDGTILEVSAIGFQVKDLAAAGLKAFPKVILISSNFVLGEAKVISYGVTGNLRRTGSICSVTKNDYTQDSVLRKFSSQIITLITGKNIIKTYPNPVAKGATINVDMKAVAKGEYHLQMINSIGSVLQDDKISIPDKNFIYQLQLKPTISSGTYFLNLISSESKIIYKGKIVVL